MIKKIISTDSIEKGTGNYLNNNTYYVVVPNCQKRRIKKNNKYKEKP